MSANSDGSSSRGIRIVGRSIKVVEHDGLTVLETIGNVATQTDGVSLALVTITKPTSEPWLTLHYDEYMHVTEGYIELLHEEDDETKNTVTTSVEEGQTVFIPKGSRFRPVFPVPAKYIPLCIPAFSPGRCVREEGAEVSDVSARLNELHRNTTLPSGSSSAGEEDNANVRILYHMCRTSSYERAVSANAAYFPPTFVQDGRFTHATAIPSTLIATANHFYVNTPLDDDWICLELDREVLEKRVGIIAVFESAAPVGDIDTDKSCDLVVPHIYGGIPVHVDGVVTKVYKMNRSREDGTFLGIDGLV